MTASCDIYFALPSNAVAGLKNRHGFNMSLACMTSFSSFDNISICMSLNTTSARRDSILCRWSVSGSAFARDRADFNSFLMDRISVLHSALSCNTLSCRSMKPVLLVMAEYSLGTAYPIGVTSGKRFQVKFRCNILTLCARRFVHLYLRVIIENNSQA